MLSTNEKKKLHIIKRLMASLGISQLKNDMLHISRHHWREQALDYVRSQGGRLGMTHIYEFDTREEWLEVTTIEDEADIFSHKPKLRVFLSPNCTVDEWPALISRITNGGSNIDPVMNVQGDVFRNDSSEIQPMQLVNVSTNHQDPSIEYLHDCGNLIGYGNINQDIHDMPPESLYSGATSYTNYSSAFTLGQQDPSNGASYNWEPRIFTNSSLRYCDELTHNFNGSAGEDYLQGRHTHVDNGLNELANFSFDLSQHAHQTAPPKVEPIPLRHWISSVKLCIGDNEGMSVVRSRVFVKSALLIATFLAEQLTNDDFIEFVPIGSTCDWAESVTVKLKKDQFDTFYQELDADYPNNSSQQNGERKFSVEKGKDSITELASFEERHGLCRPDESDLPKSACNDQAITLHSKNLNCIHVEYAEIHCPDSKPSYVPQHDANKENAKRLFYLGLVFYELFSGGELPPTTLQNLASCDGAFVSLSSMALVKKCANDDQDLSYDDQDFVINTKHHQGPSASEDEIGLCQLSCEYLKFIGVTGNLCHLILNMLNAVYGDSGGDECYSHITDVTADLKLMLSGPSKFLWGLNISSISSTGLQLCEMDIPREHEFQSIKYCFQRCAAGSCEIFVIKGESGSGKTWLAQRAVSFIVGEGGVLLSGKFDQMDQSKPFSALSTAFDEYCDMLVIAKKSSWAQTIIHKLNEDAVLKRDGHHLFKMIPKLGLIVDDGSCHTESSALDISCDNALQRLHFLICRFVEVITTTSRVSLSLFMDDVQWADEASVNVLTRLVTRGYRKFLFIGCCRDDEMESNHPFTKMLDSAQASGVNATEVKLSCFDKETLNRAISNLLHLSPRLVKPLSDIVHNKTRGNILFVSQLVLSLQRDGLLHVDFDRQRWVWDENKILSMKLPENVALCFTNGILKLPVEEQVALHTLSMFGASVKSEYLKLLESQLGLTLLDPLEKASMDGLVNKLKTTFQFTHDRIQETSYDLIGGQFRLDTHLMYGKCLVQHSYETGDGELLFLAVNQFNLAGPSVVSDPAECFAIAKHNFAAGKRAMSISDFALSYSYLNHGISFLGRDHWADQYCFSLELYELACKAALAIGNIQALSILSSEIMQNARTFEDKLTTHYIIMSSLFCASKVAEAVDKGLAMLSELHEGIPSDPSKELLLQRIKQTQLCIRGISENDILNRPIMTDFKMLMAMKFLSRLQIMTLYTNSKLSTYIIMKMVDITLSNGKKQSRYLPPWIQ
jgi:predicted ATPase